MAIRIVRNDTGNCINFVGSTQPAYWNACLSAEVDAEDDQRINIINDIQTTNEGETIYEFYKVFHTDFADADGNPFATAADAVAYINANANVAGTSPNGIVATENTTIDFSRDGTNTTVLFSNGDAYGVNSIKAVAENGFVSIQEHSDDGATLITELRYENLTITGSSAGSTLEATVNALNALFTVTPIAGGTDTSSFILPTLPEAQVTGNIREYAVPTTLKEPGVPHTATTGSDTSTGHGARFWSNETIDTAGEFFTVRITGGGRFILGLVETSSDDFAELTNDTGNGHSGLYWGNAFYDYGDYTAPWTNYGTVSQSAYGPGWTPPNTTVNMRYNTDVQANFDSITADGQLFKVGINEEGYLSVYYYDINRSNTWILTSRNAYTTPAGNYALVVKLWDRNITLVEYPKVNLFDEVAVALTYYYVESPDGVFNYPLFQTAAEANQYDTDNGGAGANTQIVFPDDSVPGRVWYAPATSYVNNGAVAPSNTVDITWNAVTTLADEQFAPADLTLNNQTAVENTSINIQIVPQDTTVTVSGLPPGLQYGAGYITGTTPYVAADEDYLVTVSRSNAYGTNNQTFTFTVTDNASLGDLTGYTEIYGNTVQPNRIILSDDAILQTEAQISPGQELTYSYSSGQNPPTIGFLSTTGQTNLDAFDSATNTLGTDPYDFAQEDYWSLRYVSFGGYIGGTNERNRLVGWTDNTAQSGSEGTLNDVQFKLEYGTDNYLRLYVGNVLKLTSSTTFTGAQTLTLAGFDNQAQTDIYIPSNWTIANTGAGSTTPPTGFTDPVESGEMESLTVFGNGVDGAVFLTETLKVNHRYIVPQTWIEANVLPNIAGTGAETNGELFFFGVPKDTADFSSINELNNYHAHFRLEGAANSHISRIYTSGISGISEGNVSVSSATDAFYDYAIEWDGTDLHVIACNIGDINTQPGVSSGGSFSRTVTLSDFATDHGKTNTELNLVIAIKNGAKVNLTTSGLQQIRTPFGARDVVVGEASGGGSMFALAPAASVYDSHSNGHASTTFGMSYTAPTLNAGYTYRFIYHPSMETGDDFKFTRIDDGTDYTLGVTFFDGTSNGDPNFTDGYKGVTFAVPSDAPPLNVAYNNDHQGNTNYVLKPLPLSGSTYVVPVTGITLEGPAANQTGTNVMDAGDHGWISLDEQLSAGERLVLDNAFFADFLDETQGTNNIFAIGLKGDNWTNTKEVNNQQSATSGEFFKGNTYLVGVWSSGASSVTMTLISNGSVGNSMLMNSSSLFGTACAFLEITASGNNIRGGFGRNNSTGNITAGDESTVAYADWNAYKGQTGDHGYGISSIDVVMSFWTFGGGAIDGNEIDWTGLTEISVPTPASTLTTSWTKALDFSGSSERTQMVNSSQLYNPLNMGNQGTTVAAPATSGNTSNSANARPWATAIVFSSDNNSSNQHIWNNGEGAGSTDDNIYLRVDSNRNLYFGWGRTGALNECSLGTLSSGSGNWYGVYIAHNGTRLNTSNATPVNLAAAFDIRLINLETGVVGGQISQSTNWNMSGGRMDRQLTGSFTIGGRGSNRNFHGKVASMVVTTLRTNVAMPADAEISMMVRDPMQWLTDYKVGQSYRRPSVGTDHTSNFVLNSLDSSYATQVWLMGDGTSDAFAQIRNQVYNAEQNRTPLNMISMVSNDIETVSITGLT